MGIDRIGRAGGTAGVASPTTTAAEPSAAISESFAAVAKRAVVAPEAVPLLEQLKAGQIDLNRFLDLRVEQATAHLQAVLDPERLQFIRQSLRIQLQSDPGLLDLVKAATGASPPQPDRE